MVSAVSGSTSNQYRYDGHNRRVKQVKTKPNGSTETEYSLYSQNGTLLYRETPDGPSNYIYLGKKLIAKDGYFKLNAGKQHYQPFGGSIEGELDDIGYTGHKFDQDIGLSYMQARYYDPVIGRFLSNDPVDVLGHMEKGNPVHGFGRYTYANNNPYKYVDPDGEFAFLAPLVPPAIAAAKVTLGVGAAVGTVSVLSEAFDQIGQMNESSDPVSGVLEGATSGEKTKGRTKNFDKPGGLDQANSDFDDLVDPDNVESITDSKGGEGRRGTVNDGSGRKVNVRPNSTDGRPTVEIQDGKNKTKIRYDNENN